MAEEAGRSLIRPLDAVLLAAIALPILLFGYSFWANYRALQHNVDERMERSAELAQEHALKVVQTVDRVLSETREILRLPNQSVRQNQKTLNMRLSQTQAAVPELASIWAFDATGQAMVSSSVYPVPLDLNNSDRRYFRDQQVAGNDAVFISGVLRSKTLDRNFFVMSRRRTLADGNFNGIVAAFVLPEAITSFYEKMARGTGFSTGLYLPDGNVLARYPTPVTGTSTKALVMEIARHPERGSYTAVSGADSVERHALYRRLPGYPIYVVVGYSTAQFWHELWGILAPQILFGVPATLLVILMAVVARRRTADLEAELARRRQAEIAAREAESRFRLLVEGVTDYAIYMLSPEGNVTNWNAGARRIKGYEAGEIIGQSFARFYTEEDRAAAEPWHALALAAKSGRFEKEGWRVRKDGTRFWAHVILDAIYENGKLIGYAKVVRDITERRNAQIALEQAREQLFQAQKMEAIGQLTGGIAHDFNNLLTGILGSLKLLEKRINQGRPEAVGRYVEAATASANRAAALTHRLLAFARRQSLDVKPTDVPRLIRSMEDLLRRTIGENIELVVDIAPDLWPAMTDGNQLETALLNLVINARDAMPRGGRITIRAENATHGEADATGSEGLTPGDYVRLRVTDTGAGMPPDVVNRAFEPFFTTKPIGQGTGLGLPMIYGFARQSGGRARIESTIGTGTSVMLCLPSVDPDTLGESLEEEPAPEPQGEGETILLVEDDTAVRLVVLDVLGELGYRVTEARDATAALPVLQSKERIDLLISDVGLPGMNGRELAEIARRYRPGLPVLFVTGYAEGAVLRGGFLGEGMDMVTKPFAIETLAAKVRTMLAPESDETPRAAEDAAGKEVV
jgi:PAS domain S-box-containing protein